jgi:hypothetical protein
LISAAREDPDFMSDDANTLRTCFDRDGFLRLVPECAARSIDFLRSQLGVLAERIARPRPWHYAELHNPWSRAAAVYDSWAFLDLASEPAILNAVSAVLGPDIILYDSQWFPDPLPCGAQEDWIADVHRLPVEPCSGVTALLGVVDWHDRGWRLECVLGSHEAPGSAAPVHDISPRTGELLICDARLSYRMRGTSQLSQPLGYAMRYFPASSRYLRSADCSVHRQLTERYPLLNYAKMPLWLVRGMDRANNDFVTGFNPRAARWAHSGNRATLQSSG